MQTIPGPAYRILTPRLCIRCWHPADAAGLERFVDELDRLLRAEHAEDYCGIVYADSLERPEFVKIFDPNNLGVSCGFSENPPLPGWVLSKMKPVNLEAALRPPKR